MQSLADFFAMGGYAGYVWPAYGVAAITFMGLLAASWHQLRQAREMLRLYDSQSGADQP
jgi:heme exporter protein D